MTLHPLSVAACARHADAPLTVPCPACSATSDKHDPRTDEMIAYRCRNPRCDRRLFLVAMPRRAADVQKSDWLARVRDALVENW